MKTARESEEDGELGEVWIIGNVVQLEEEGANPSAGQMEILVVREAKALAARRPFRVLSI